MMTAWAGNVPWKRAVAAAAVAVLAVPVAVPAGQLFSMDVLWLSGLAGVATLLALALPLTSPPKGRAGTGDIHPHRPSPDRMRLLEGIMREMRQPLDNIQGFAELLHSPAAADMPEKDLNAYRQMMVDSSRSLAAFLRQVKDFAQLEQGQARLIDSDTEAAELAEAAVRLCREAAELADVHLIASLEDGIELRCDVSRIRQSIVALVRHAIRRTPRRGTVRIDMRLTPGGGLDIAVSDGGLPVAPGEAERGFDPDIDRLGFESFALPVARRFVLLHGGDVFLSVTAGGICTRLSLPANRVSGGATAGAA